jgi:transposase-like protein
MLNIEFLSREDLTATFPNEQSCIKHLENLRWNNQIISPFDKKSKVYACKDDKFRCRNSGKYFNVRTNTIFHNSRIPLQKWFIAVWIISNGKRGITSVALGQELDITQKTAWFMLQRIKNYLDIGKGIETRKIKTRILPTKTVKPVKILVPKFKKKPKEVVVEEKSIGAETDKMKMSDWLMLLKKQ